MSDLTTVLVKSFNRPYYLDRCLSSISKLLGGHYQVIVLDDGTPPVYLNEIIRRHPTVELRRSNLYEQKVGQIREHVQGNEKFNLRVIPTDLWVSAVEQASDIFLMLEDDIWLTKSFDLDEMVKTMQERRIILSKLYWGGNPDGFHGKLGQTFGRLQEYNPKLPALPGFLLDALLRNKFKLASVFYRLGLIKEGIYFQLPFYDLYSVASAVFSKQYWLHLWHQQQVKADETYQLVQGMRWVHNHPNDRFAKSDQELTQTSFITSATNNYKDIDFDVFAFNHYINEAWLQGLLGADQRLPRDFDPTYFKSVLDQAQDPRCTYANWLQWIQRFKEIYSSMGCIIEE